MEDKAFFVNTIAGSHISRSMTNDIFSALFNAKRTLDVSDIVILKEGRIESTLNYSEIKEAFLRRQGTTIDISFIDEPARKILDSMVDSTDYDSPDSVAHRLDMPKTTNIHVEVKTRPFSFDAFFLNPDDLKLLTQEEFDNSLKECHPGK